MRFRWRWLDRVWLGLIAVAAVIAVPVWLVLMSERLGTRLVIAAVVFVAVFSYRNRILSRTS